VSMSCTNFMPTSLRGEGMPTSSHSCLLERRCAHCAQEKHFTQVIRTKNFKV
jgi:hypothetical protein